MEETPEGLANAAAVRQAAKRKREELSNLEAELDAPPAKRRERPPPVLRHEVSTPEGFEEASLDLDPKVHGKKIQTAAASVVRDKTLSGHLGVKVPLSSHIGQESLQSFILSSWTHFRSLP